MFARCKINRRSPFLSNWVSPGAEIMGVTYFPLKNFIYCVLFAPSSLSFNLRLRLSTGYCRVLQDIPSGILNLFRTTVREKFEEVWRDLDNPTHLKSLKIYCYFLPGSSTPKEIYLYQICLLHLAMRDDERPKKDWKRKLCYFKYVIMHCACFYVTHAPMIHEHHYFNSMEDVALQVQP